MGIRTPNKLVTGMRTSGKLATGIRTPNKLHTFGAEPPMPPAETAAQAAARIMAVLGVAGGHFIDCTFSDHNNRKFQNGIDGTLHTVYPATMFTDDTIFRMFRLRVSGSPLSINLWRGNTGPPTYSYLASDTPIQAGRDFYVINCDDREWAAWPATEAQTLAESSVSFTDSSVDAANVRTNASIIQEPNWVDAMDLKRVIFGFSDNQTYDPFPA